MPVIGEEREVQLPVISPKKIQLLELRIETLRRDLNELKRKVDSMNITHEIEEIKSTLRRIEEKLNYLLKLSSI